MADDDEQPPAIESGARISEPPISESPKTETPADVLLSRIRNEVKRTLDLAEYIEDMKMTLAKAEEKYKNYSQNIIPDIMREYGVDEIKIDGVKVTLRSDVHPSIPEPRDNAFKWLDQNGFGGLIKTEVKIAFPRDEREQAIEFKRELEEQGMVPEMKENVHYQTLRSWAKERMDAGQSVPDDLFHLNPFTEVKFTIPKI
jgi:ribosomal protein S21